jgi:amino acid permease
MEDHHHSSEGQSLFRSFPPEGRISESSFAALIRRDSEFSVTAPSSEFYGSIREEEGAVGNHHHHGEEEEPEQDGNRQHHREQQRGGALSPTTPLLNVWQGATLLTADCLGTGLLALPGDMKVLGNVIGLSFLIFNLPINYYAGYIFHHTATSVESQQAQENQLYRQTWQKVLQNHSDYESFRGQQQQHTLQLLLQQQKKDEEEDYSEEKLSGDGIGGDDGGGPTTTALDDPHDERRRRRPPHYLTTVHHDSASADFIGLSSALFFRQKNFTRLVMLVFYVNIFLVLGNYQLVMSHALVAFSDDTLCLPTAGGLATVFMIAMTSQMRTMARLGRAASIVSLVALAIVVAQCLWAIHHQHRPTHAASTSIVTEQPSISPSSSLLRKLSALGSIGFAVGSQKLFLNIRHDLADRSDAPKTLGLSLSLFGLAYIGLCVGAGPNPPGFLLDAIPPHSWHRRVAGLLLFVHVIVSYCEFRLLVGCTSFCYGMFCVYLSLKLFIRN